MKLRKGQFYAVKFLDHAEGGDSPIEFRVCGRLVNLSDRRSIVIRCWEYADGRTRNDSNETKYVICRSAITGIDRLVKSS
jgi:hypothetical protein